MTRSHQIQMAASAIFVYRDFGWVATPRMTGAQLIKVGKHVFFRYDSGVHWDKQFADLADSGLA
jgi:hypothetical protein